MAHESNATYRISKIIINNIMVVYKDSKLSLYVIIVTFILIVCAMLIINKLYVVNEKYNSSPSPVFSYSEGKWITPVKGKYIERYRNLKATSRQFTISFWLRIDKLHPTWRNVFHFGSSWSLEWNPTGNPSDIVYNPWEDLLWNRRPAVFITPNDYSIHICHDTRSSYNNPFNMKIPNEGMITMVWESNIDTNVHECRTFVNDTPGIVFKYNNRLEQTEGDAMVYLCDRNTYCSIGDCAVRDFKFFNRLLDLSDISTLYNNSK